MDADKEGFLRSESSLIQTIGRAARNERGKVILYADHITESIRKTLEDNERKREKQLAYNLAHGITPRTVMKSKDEIMKQTSVADAKQGNEANYYVEPEEATMAADPIVQYMNKEQLQKAIDETQKRMMKAAREMEFMEAARLRDEVYALQEKLKELN
jgi:excinuclease ABC subunit B